MCRSVSYATYDCVLDKTKVDKTKKSLPDRIQMYNMNETDDVNCMNPILPDMTLKSLMSSPYEAYSVKNYKVNPIQNDSDTTPWRT